LWSERPFREDFRMERRTHDRDSETTVVGIERGLDRSGIGISKDISVGGLVLQSSRRLRKGEQVNLRVPTSECAAYEVQVRATVVRVWENEPQWRTAFPFLAAVRFHEPIVDAIE